MLPDADFIIACPHCHAPARVIQLMSGNTFGAITWTDGWMDAPMLPRAPRIARCAKCSKIYWVAFAPQLGFGGVGRSDAWQDAPRLETLDEAACFEALRNGLSASPDLELELRVFTWWRGNDAFREPMRTPGYPMSAEAVANMERMIEMTSGGEEDLLLFRAEAQRHLARFDDARTTLEGVGCSDYWPAKSRQLELLEAHSRDLAILFSADRPPIEPDRA
jgi:hypothetical protein